MKYKSLVYHIVVTLTTSFICNLYHSVDSYNKIESSINNWNDDDSNGIT